MPRRLNALIALLLATGCSDFVGDGGPPPPCEGAYEPAGYLIRDPETGMCVDAGATTCIDGVPSDTSTLDWGLCSSYCDDLDEQSCLAADACRAIYVPFQTSGPSGAVRVFSACWSTATSGPIRGGSCEGLDAYECSRHDDCSAVHASAGGQAPGSYLSCVDETDCSGMGAAPAQELRNPDTGACELGGGGGGIDPCTLSDGPPAPIADWGICGSYCEAFDEATCTATDGCRVILANLCAPWQDCFAVDFVACWPIAPSGPDPAVACDGLSAYDCSRHNNCSAEHDRDWASCDPMGTSCSPPLTGFLACHPENLQ